MRVIACKETTKQKTTTTTTTTTTSIRSCTFSSSSYFIHTKLFKTALCLLVFLSINCLNVTADEETSPPTPQKTEQTTQDASSYSVSFIAFCSIVILLITFKAWRVFSSSNSDQHMQKAAFNQRVNSIQSKFDKLQSELEKNPNPEQYQHEFNSLLRSIDQPLSEVQKVMGLTQSAEDEQQHEKTQRQHEQRQQKPTPVTVPLASSSDDDDHLSVSDQPPADESSSSSSSSDDEKVDADALMASLNATSTDTKDDSDSDEKVDADALMASLNAGSTQDKSSSSSSSSSSDSDDAQSSSDEKIDADASVASLNASSESDEKSALMARINAKQVMSCVSSSDDDKPSDDENNIDADALMASLNTGSANEDDANEDDNNIDADALMASLNAGSKNTQSKDSPKPVTDDNDDDTSVVDADALLASLGGGQQSSETGDDDEVAALKEFADIIEKNKKRASRRKNVDRFRVGRSGMRSGKKKRRSKKSKTPAEPTFLPMTSMEESIIALSEGMVAAKVQKPAKSNPSAGNALLDLFGPSGGASDNASSSSATSKGEPEQSLISLHADSDGLVRDWAVKEDMNRSGLRRAKKRPIQAGGKRGKKVLQMEDTNFCQYPWNNRAKEAMFCVYDGHVDKPCAVELITTWPAVWKDVTGGAPLSNYTNLNKLFEEAYEITDTKLKHHEYCGATCTTALLWEGKEPGSRFLQSANVGDSLAFIYRNKKAIALSEVHCVREPHEQERLRAAGVQINDGQSRINGLSVSRAIGDHFIKEVVPGFTAQPYISEVIEVQQDDSLFIVASDGLWDVVTGQEAFELIEDETSASRMANALIRYAVKSGKCNDNITVAVAILN